MKHCQSFNNKVDACRTKDELAVLTAVWERSFLNYTEAFPNRWHDPENEYSEDLQLPEHAIPFLKKLIELDGSEKAFNILQSYWEFFAAVWRIKFDHNQLQIALTLLTEITQRQNSNPYFKNLQTAVEDALNAQDASADPHKHTQYLSKD